MEKRNSKIELLRIVAMICIVISHYSYFGGFDTKYLAGNGNIANACLLNVVFIGNIGVVVFVILSGYFQIKKDFDLRRIILLIAQVLFYSIVIYIVSVIFGDIKLTPVGLIKAVLPTIFNQYWFFTAYIVLSLLSPFLNRALCSFSQDTYLKFLVAMLLMWSIVPTFTKNTLYGSELPQFLLFYSIGAYLRLYPACKINKKKVGVCLTAATIFLLFLSTVVLNLLGAKYELFAGTGVYFYNRNSILVIACATGLMIWALNSKPFHSRFVNEIAACTFGVYLIHCNPYDTKWVWQTVFRNAEWAESPWLIVHMIVCVLITFVVCTAIEFVRRKTIERADMPALGRLADWIEGKWNQLFDKYGPA